MPRTSFSSHPAPWWPFVVESMTVADLDQVMQIERVAFPSPWSVRAYRYEITQNEHSTMLVTRPAPRNNGRVTQWLYQLMAGGPGPVLGYAGFWLLVDEIHISTIAVHPQWRGRGLGELLLISLLDRGAELDARKATLEVRVSNLAAQGLYHKYGFKVISRQRRYYADNNEDAGILITEPFETPEFHANLEHCRASLQARFRTGGATVPHPTNSVDDIGPGGQSG